MFTGKDKDIKGGRYIFKKKERLLRSQVYPLISYRSMGIPSNTLSTIFKNKKRIEEHFEKLSPCGQRKMRGSKYSNVEKALIK